MIAVYLFILKIRGVQNQRKLVLYTPDFFASKGERLSHFVQNIGVGQTAMNHIMLNLCILLQLQIDIYFLLFAVIISISETSGLSHLTAFFSFFKWIAFLGQRWTHPKQPSQ